MQDGRPGELVANEQTGFDLGAVPSGARAYRVLARKYRPSTFEDLIGQEAMVRTLRNAFELNRVHQAYLLTGVRGVGKTTTARILARAFNYAAPAQGDRSAIDKPTVDMPALGVHCASIIESRHVDVIEMDAASNTGIDDIREIIESARYKPALARFKVFIIDEVHMLSKAAFNGLLKTLEEPPEHVKFVFATTEIDKVPVTVRSRCQRFDLRRIKSDVMVSHLAGICERESVHISDAALALIARAAEGSVRDALSLLDQAIAHGPSSSSDVISEEAVRDMLGIADNARVIDLFESAMKGNIASALSQLKEQYDQGADPALLITDLASFTHFVTLLKLSPGMPVDKTVTEEEMNRGKTFAETLSVQTLTRAWQILTKGLSEIREAPRPLAAADMVLVRIAHAADLPSPEDVLRKLLQSPSGASAGVMQSTPSPSHESAGTSRSALAHVVQTDAYVAPASAPRAQISRFEDLVALAQLQRDIQLSTALERDVRLVRFEHGSVEFSLAPGASPQIAGHLMRRLQEWTGERWIVAVSNEEGAPTLNERKQARQREKAIGVRGDPIVQSILERFPGAEIVSVRSTGDEVEANPYSVPLTAGDEVVYADQISDEEI